MTPDELRKLADEATPLEGKVDRLLSLGFKPEDVRLWVLSSDLARLCADLGAALREIDNTAGWRSLGERNRLDAIRVVADDALAKLSELNNGAEHSPNAERT